MDDALVRLLLLQDANTRTVLLGSAALGLAGGVVGTFAVLRRRALLTDALAHAALPGVCVAFMLLGDRSLPAFMAGAVAAGLLGVGVVNVLRSSTRVREDAAIGIVLGVFFAAGVVLSRMIQNEPTGNRAGLDSFLFGKAATMVRDDVRVIVTVAAVSVSVVALMLGPLRLLCFDRAFAASLGWPVRAMDFALMSLIALCTVAGLPAAGVVLMAALLIIPAATARLWTQRLGLMVTLAGAVGALGGAGGTALSAALPPPGGTGVRGWPTGPMIVLVLAGCFVLTLLAAPRSGLMASMVRRVRMRRRIAVQHVLRALWELDELRGADAGSPREGALSGGVTLAALAAHRAGWATGPDGRARGELALGLRLAGREGWVRPGRDDGRGIGAGVAVTLTPAGRARAERVVRGHRLWELFLIEQAQIAPDHVDRDADELEHVLGPELLARLEARLDGERPPASPHGLGRPGAGLDRSSRQQAMGGAAGGRDAAGHGGGA